MRYACTVAELGAAGACGRSRSARARSCCVVGTDEGVRAVDRACPHEGYRLDEGEVAARS